MQPGFGRWRTVTGSDHPQVVLPGQVEAHLSGREHGAALDLLDLLFREVRAIRIEAVSQAVHRPTHYPVDVGLLDVVAPDEPDHVVENLKLLVRCALAGRHAAEQAADDRKRDHRSG